MKCLIVDDEELGRTLVREYVKRIPGLEVVGEAKNPVEAIQLLNDQEVDLVFLDIQMPELSGIEFLKTISQKPEVILTTAYPEYALEGYEHDVVDYLLKPFGFPRFLKAVNKALERLKWKGKRSNNSEKAEQQQNIKNYILVNSEHKVHRVNYADILYIQSMREYVAFYLPDKRILSLKSLKKLETELPSDQFIRIHKSYIISKNKVKALEGNLVHIGKEKIPIGASYRDAVMAKLF